jgi:hypothetical protein
MYSQSISIIDCKGTAIFAYSQSPVYVIPYTICLVYCEKVSIIICKIRENHYLCNRQTE